MVRTLVERANHLLATVIASGERDSTPEPSESDAVEGWGGPNATVGNGEILSK